ncbi:MAG TPA: DUF5655 domain-containing protein [Blastocatellia bacterium]
MTRAKSTTWRCPVCAREFARKSQAHSCKVVTLESHLKKATQATLQIYSALEGALRHCGKYTTVATKSQITLMAPTSFAGLHIRRDSISLEFLMTRRIEHPRIASMLQVSQRTFAYKVQLRSPVDVDRELCEWLSEAYQVGLAAGRR